MTTNKHHGSTLESFLEEEGILEEATIGAVKALIAWQLSEEMKSKGISKITLAAQMKTSRAQLDRVLDPDNGNVTLQTLQRAATHLGRKIKLELA